MLIEVSTSSLSSSHECFVLPPLLISLLASCMDNKVCIWVIHSHPPIPAPVGLRCIHTPDLARRRRLPEQCSRHCSVQSTGHEQHHNVLPGQLNSLHLNSSDLAQKQVHVCIILLFPSSPAAQHTAAYMRHLPHYHHLMHVWSRPVIRHSDDTFTPVLRGKLDSYFLHPGIN